MAESVKVLPEDTQEMIEVHEWDLRTLEGVKRFQEIGAKSLPSIAMDGKVIYSSIIPGQEDLIEEISRRYQEKKTKCQIFRETANEDRNSWNRVQKL